MTNLINLYTKKNSDIIPARKLKKEQTGFVITPAPLKYYSIDKALKEREAYRKNLKRDVYEAQSKKQNSKKWFFIVPSAILAISIWLYKKK